MAETVTDPQKTLLSREQQEAAIRAGGSVLLPGGKVAEHAHELPSLTEQALRSEEACKQLIAQKKGEIARLQEEIKQLEEGPPDYVAPMSRDELKAWRAERAAKAPAAQPQAAKADEGSAGEKSGEDAAAAPAGKKVGPRQRQVGQREVESTPGQIGQREVEG